LTLSNAQPANAGTYSVRVTNAFGAVTSSNAVLTVLSPPSPILAGPITNAANRHAYYLLSATNWPAAEAIAVSLGGHLVTINDAAENTWVFTNFSTFGGGDRALWTGLTDQETEGDWRWISGDLASYRNWAPGEPNSGGGFFPDEDHVLMWNPNSGYPPGSWTDAPSNQLHAAVVELPIARAVRLTSLVREPGTYPRLRFGGVAGNTYSVQASTNLKDWEIVGFSVADSNGLGEFEDSASTGLPCRYYRVVMP
jgi:hypothetical protein